jgi:uncharacterized repeat protein (TIGR03803 family)
MPNKKFSIASSLVAAVLLLVLSTIGGGTRAAAQEESVVTNFNSDGAGGAAPYGGLIFDKDGNLYGTTANGGNGPCATSNTTGCGTVFKLSPKAGGGWTKTVIHVFDGGDGSFPNAGLILDGAGNLYGTTVYGGTGVCNAVAPTGCGVVFELARTAKGGWAEKILRDFGNGEDGPYPAGGLVLDGAGNLYGMTTGNRGACGHSPSTNCGAVFELMPRATGHWAEKVLHLFSYNFIDGYAPTGSLVLDEAGNLYGGTPAGGTYDTGIAFRLSPNANGGWAEKVLYTFYWGKGVTGSGPATLIRDAAGNLYGTAIYGGASGWGAVFELSPAAGGTWTQTVLHSFTPSPLDGIEPNPNLIFDNAGNLYGATQYGGSGKYWCLTWGGGNEAASCGTVFELAPAGNGAWNETILYNFGAWTDGWLPNSGVIRDAAGNLYGTTILKGSAGGGIVFEITP